MLARLSLQLALCVAACLVAPRTYALRSSGKAALRPFRALSMSSSAATATLSPSKTTAAASAGIAALNGVQVTNVATQATVDLGRELSAQAGTTVLVLGTYAADFNAIEYAQRLRHYQRRLKDKGVTNFAFVLNAEPAAAAALAKFVDLPSDIALYADPFGTAGKAWGCERGFEPDNSDLSPYVKLFAMLFGLGAWATLPSVIGGYVGNPFVPQPWIEEALAQNQAAGRWPDTALELDGSGKVVSNKFKELPVVGSWGRRPLELATLRLQNMLGVSLKEWAVLRPSEAALQQGVLTQLGACVVLADAPGDASSTNGNGNGNKAVRYVWKDEGICDVCNFETLMRSL